MGTPLETDGRFRSTDCFRTVSEMLDNGECEPTKAAVHAVLMATVGVCAAYNIAAWIKRRQTHLAINAMVYSTAVLWERCHVVHHLRSCRGSSSTVSSTDKLKDAA